MGLVKMDACFLKDSGRIIAMKPPGSDWSKIERGDEAAHSGVVFGVATVEVDEDTIIKKMSGSSGLDVSGEAVPVKPEVAIEIGSEEKIGDLMVNDTASPKTVVLRKDK